MQVNGYFQFSLWDVGHGLAIWIKTPSGHNHWIDAGKEGDFSPSRHVFENYGESSLDYLIISHPDNDHINDLGNLVRTLGFPRVLVRNNTLPSHEKFESGTLDHQQAFMSLDRSYTAPVPWVHHPQNPAFNGGVEIRTAMLNWDEAGWSANNSSVVAFYHYAGWLFVMPGDIEESAWVNLWARNEPAFSELVERSRARVLVAPHHGRESGYSPSMFDQIKPHITLVSDKKAKAPTCGSFRTRPIGLEHNPYSRILETPFQSSARQLFSQPQSRSLVDMIGRMTTTKRFISTKSGGRAQFTIDSSGNCHLHVVEK
ncbi:MAG: MBL fold metallo-hydrolase [Verrucomicrobiales bacterium]|nr:MBL fold metallo-hydrolase [Verrucomicrobiales bacterium]